MALFLQHIGGRFALDLARILPENEGGDPNNPQIDIERKIDTPRHPALGDKASYINGDLYDTVTGRAATKQQLENDPDFRRGIWEMPPGDFLPYLFAHEFKVSLSVNSPAGNISFSGTYSIYQESYKRTQNGETEESSITPGEFEKFTYHDAKGRYHPLQDGSWDWNKRARRGFSIFNMGKKDAPPIWEPRQPGWRGGDTPSHAVPAPPDSPMGRLSQPYSMVREIRVDSANPEPLPPQQFNGILHLVDPLPEWPAIVSVVITFNDDVTYPGTRRFIEALVGVGGGMVYFAKYGVWRRPASVTVTGITTKNDFHMSDRFTITYPDDFPVNPQHHWSYSFDEETIALIDEGRNKRHEELIKRTEIKNYKGGTRWSPFPPSDYDGPKDKSQRLNVMYEITPITDSILPVFSPIDRA